MRPRTRAIDDVPRVWDRVLVGSMSMVLLLMRHRHCCRPSSHTNRPSPHTQHTGFSLSLSLDVRACESALSVRA